MHERRKFFQRMVELSTVRAMLDEMVKFDETFYYSNRAEAYRAEAAEWQVKLDAIDEAANAEEDDRVARAEARDYQKVEDCHR